MYYYIYVFSSFTFLTLAINYSIPGITWLLFYPVLTLISDWKYERRQLLQKFAFIITILCLTLGSAANDWPIFENCYSIAFSRAVIKTVCQCHCISKIIFKFNPLCRITWFKSVVRGCDIYEAPHIYMRKIFCTSNTENFEHNILL